jgi:hypothetical protein
MAQKQEPGGSQMAKRKVVLPALSLAAISIAALVIALATSSASAHKGRHLHPAARASDNAAILNAFSVLRTAASSGGAPLPEGVGAAASNEAAGASKTEPELTGEVKVQGQYPVWIAPESGKICLLQEGIVGPGIADSVCGTDQEALEGKLIKYSGKYPSGGPVIVGLAPNGNTSVIAREANGSGHTLSVTDNVYEIVGYSPQTISLINANGQATAAQVP